MIVTHGGIVGGYGLYLRREADVRLQLPLARRTTSRDPPCPRQGAAQGGFRLPGRPKELGKAAYVTMTVNGKNVAEGQLPRTIPATISIGEGMDIGEDVGSPVDFTYKPPFKFTGTIDKVTFDLEPSGKGKQP
jgi:arylsulfatase